MNRAWIDRIIAAGLGALALTLLGAWVMPQWLGKTDGWYAPFAVVSFIVRTMHWHLAIGLVVAAMGLLIARRRRLGVLALLLAVGSASPEARRWFMPARPAADVPTTRLMSVNVYYANFKWAHLRGSIEQADPDVLMFQEYSERHHAELSPWLSERYPHAIAHPSEWGFGGVALFSKLPLGESEFLPGVYSKPALRTKLTLRDGTPITLIALHLRSPQTPRLMMMNRLEAHMLLTRLSQIDGPLVVAGDFNFTDTSPQAAALRHAGMSSAHDLAGSGRATTWPVRGRARWLPGFRIDHVFVSRALTATHFATGAPTGSDHLPIVADLAPARDFRAGASSDAR